MVPAVVAIDEKGRPLRPAILQNDARAVAELAELATETAQLDLVSLTGSPLSQQSVGPTLRWLARHEAELLAGDVDGGRIVRLAPRRSRCRGARRAQLGDRERPFDLAGEQLAESSHSASAIRAGSAGCPNRRR